MWGAGVLNSVEQGVAGDGTLGDDVFVCWQLAVKDDVGEDWVELDEAFVLLVDEVLSLDVGSYDGSELGCGEEGAVVGVALVTTATAENR